MGEEKGPEYYKVADRFREHYAGSSYMPMWKFVLEMIPRDPELNILELGSGGGQFSHLLHDMGYKHYIGIDFSQKAVEVSRNLSDEFEMGHTILQNNIVTDDISEYIEKADIVIILETLEHIQDDIGVVKKLSGKRYIISLPTFDCESHVRHFGSIEEVIDRYGKYLCIFNSAKVGNIFIITGKGRENI